MKIQPNTRRVIVIALTAIALVAVISEVVLELSGRDASPSMLNLAAVAIGGLAGIALPTGVPDDGGASVEQAGPGEQAASPQATSPRQSEGDDFETDEDF